MQRLIILLFILPWWAYLPMAGGVFWMGEQIYQKELAKQADREEALRLPPPDPVDLSDFDRSAHVSPAREVHITGWVDFDYNYELVKSTNGVTTGRRFMFVLFGRDDEFGSKTPRAFLLLTKAEKEIFVEQIDDYITGFGTGGPELTINGFSISSSFSSQAREAMEDEGLTPGYNMPMIQPFVHGREAALASDGTPGRHRMTWWLIAAAVAGFGVMKWRRKAQKAKNLDVSAAEGAGLAAYQVPESMPVAGQPGLAQNPPSAPMADSVTPDSPLARITRRLDEERAAREAPPVPEPAPETAVAAKSGVPTKWIALGAMGLIGIAMAISPNAMFSVIPIAVIVGFWFFVFKGGQKLSAAFSGLFGGGETAETEAEETPAPKGLFSTGKSAKKHPPEVQIAGVLTVLGALVIIPRFSPTNLPMGLGEQQHATTIAQIGLIFALWVVTYLIAKAIRMRFGNSDADAMDIGAQTAPAYEAPVQTVERKGALHLARRVLPVIAVAGVLGFFLYTAKTVELFGFGDPAEAIMAAGGSGGSGGMVALEGNVVPPEIEALNAQNREAETLAAPTGTIDAPEVAQKLTAMKADFAPEPPATVVRNATPAELRAEALMAVAPTQTVQPAPLDVAAETVTRAETAPDPLLAAGSDMGAPEEVAIPAPEVPQPVVIEAEPVAAPAEPAPLPEANGSSLKLLLMAGAAGLLAIGVLFVAWRMLPGLIAGDTGTAGRVSREKFDSTEEARWERLAHDARA